MAQRKLRVLNSLQEKVLQSAPGLEKMSQGPHLLCRGL